MCAQSPTNFDLPSIKEIVGSLIFQQLEMAVMMMMVWNLLSVGDCPDSEEKTLTKNLCLMLTNLVAVDFFFQFWFDDAFNVWCREEILSEFREIFIFTLEKV